MAGVDPAVAQQYNAMKNKFNSYASKINELEVERNEHALVVTSMEKLEPGRKCFRLISGVLVERTVGEVLPAVRKNLEGVRIDDAAAQLTQLELEGVLKQLHAELEKTEKELTAFAAKHKLRSQDDEDTSPAEKDKEKKSSVGVLV